MSSTATTTFKQRWLPLFLLFFVAFVPSLHRFQNDFVTDDRGMILRRDTIHSLANLPSVMVRHAMAVSTGSERQRRGPIDTYRPLTISTFFLDAQLSGRRPWAYHATNLLLHASCVALLYALLRRKNSAWIALGAASCFALSPELSEAHVWINGRSDVCCALFLLLALHLRSRLEETTIARSLLLGLCFLAAMLSKETAVTTLPLLFLFPPSKDEPSAPLLPHRPLLVLSSLLGSLLLYGFLRSLAMPSLGVKLNAEQWQLAVLRVPWFVGESLRALLFAPEFRLHWIVDDVMASSIFSHLFGVFVLALLVFSTLRLLRVLPWLSYGLAWFLFSLAPAFVLTALRGFGFGRFLYVPALGIALCIATLLTNAPRWTSERMHSLGAKLFLAYLVLLGVRFVQTVSVWKNEETLAIATIEAAPDRPGGYAMLGSNRRNAGQFSQAMQLYLRADQCTPWNPGYLRNAGEIALEQGNLDDALGIGELGIRRYRDALPAFRSLAGRALHSVDAHRAQTHLARCGELLHRSSPCGLGLEEPIVALP